MEKQGRFDNNVIRKSLSGVVREGVCRWVIYVMREDNLDEIKRGNLCEYDQLRCTEC